MQEYEEILRYLSENPPHMDSERNLHASLLELLANCLRDEKSIIDMVPQGVAHQLGQGHISHLY